MECPPRPKLVTVVERWPLLGEGLTVIKVNDEFFGAAFVSLEIKVLVIYRNKSQLFEELRFWTRELSPEVP